MNTLREHVIEAVVVWKLGGKGPDDDPRRLVWDLIDSATPQELIEALKRVRVRSLPV